MKNKQPHHKAERNEWIVQYYQDHSSEISLATIAKMFGISRQRVAQLIKRAKADEVERLKKGRG